ncbi:MAG: trigger factor [Alistipes sp.]|jgi:trigger factor|nr:trigger factor [Alistipes sp.]MBQ5719202.1 trigger factor [Alistipes sp.]MBQ5831351.1 trigger factor [Alistipes sp.]MBR0333214.1 trigger factor [Alistipes sp.]
MKITREQREVGTSVLKVVVGEADYGEAVDKALREYKRKVNVPGFRPGMVPMGVVRKMYGKGVVAEQAYKLASNSVFEYLQKENIDYVGDVIPSEEQGDFDFDNNTEHEFMFEIGEAPKIEMELTKDDKLTYNKIKVEAEIFEAYKDNYLRRYGRLVDVEKVEKDEALTVTLDNGDMRIEGAYLGLISMSDDERKPFEGKKVGDTMEIDVNEVYKSASQRASILQVKEDELETINPKFTAEITQIRQFANPELNEEFFKMAFPDGKITSEAELDKYLNDEVEMEMGREADYLFTIRVRNFLMEKAALQMPEAFLKRWLYTINEGKFSMEDIEKDFDAFLKMFTWNYIQKHFIQTYELTVSPEEIEAEAKEFAKAQFAQYGMPSAPEEMITNFSKQILENKEQAQKIYEKLYELKVVEYVKSKIKVTNKSVTSEEFAKLAQEM